MSSRQKQCRRLVSSLIALTLLVPVATPQVVFAHAEINRKVLRSTVLVFTNVGGEYTAVCTGVLVDERRGSMITGLAPIGGAHKVVVRFPRFIDGKPITKLASCAEDIDRLGNCGRVVATDAVRDLALIELSSVPDDALALRPAAGRGVSFACQLSSNRKSLVLRQRPGSQCPAN